LKYFKYGSCLAGIAVKNVLYEFFFSLSLTVVLHNTC